MIKKKAIKNYNNTKNVVIILACGESLRFKSKVPKQFTNISGEILLNHTINNFLKNSEIGHILLVLNKKHKKHFIKITKNKRISITYGGDTRQKSVFNGLIFVNKFRPLKVLIHDANRPFVDSKLISQLFAQLKKYKVVIPRMKIQDTIKKIETNRVSSINRDKIFAFQEELSWKKHVMNIKINF